MKEVIQHKETKITENTERIYNSVLRVLVTLWLKEVE